MKKSLNIFPEYLQIAYKELEEYISSMVKLTEEEIEELHRLFIPTQLKRNFHFIREGKICDKIAFVSRGMMRFYHIKNDSEITSDFVFEGNFVTSYHSLITRHPSDLSIQVMEDSFLLEMSYEQLLKQYQINHKYERIGRLIAEQTFLTSRNHLLSFLNESAEQRYVNLVKKAPHFVQRIPLHYIASYLGISPETLSRIRRKLSIS